MDAATSTCVDFLAMKERERELVSPTGEVHFVPFGPRLHLQHGIDVGNRVFWLRGVFVTRIEHMSDGTVFVSHPSLPVHGYGADLPAAIDAFSFMFAEQWALLVDESTVEELTEGGRRRRAAMEAAVERIENRPPRA